ncbi:nicotinate-nucleotide/dimethylbenzimidazole phosphoribosyltransferase [Gluconacetobacter diazotrophicus PA1 5]|uniref:Nicotinate-nucleotide--dimethylbenzimidazole phosphoribosyltransferase n=1 Tax=Gluconacetobacter diazotrophicus TaxID=33996 RepID=A0A7W4FE52_GLUDI|nr:nicotinate-nucleotide--dimethylbenzimidazole phosphoribosyltransferase [Gluconacetobacter diazotrophicus]ACI50954.1 nicotinate-nucleotide/dimethylbenzimidazole phosphoribosyltransferase [Gluconacetobacter diazotrophicus PA1 5]MBB2156111.1 nicotinate-nucleotide--dimethylbenzimidazole phosphoribosyltransferase [Gluconacetobacter diazotrophicus]TWB08591.1 nicotinate-nucleotide-dimethylbenzimidazole phosphoribosyltransferase [Gluconacetobacter diazotrophicus]
MPAPRRTSLPFPTPDALRAACADLPPPDEAARYAIAAREATLTKPPGSLGRLEELAAWLGAWQGRERPALDRVRVVVFAGNHGVVARGVSPWPASVTAQMVANFAAGGAAINQIARVAGAGLTVVPMMDLAPTADFTVAPAMDQDAFLAAVATGHDAVEAETDLLCLGEMGIGNTTAAAALAASLYGGSGADWAGPGAGSDADGVARKARTIDAALARHAGHAGDPLALARCLGGYEMAAILGAVLAARQKRVPVVLDGFICTAAAAPLLRLNPDGLAHTVLSHRSAEAAHGVLARHLGLEPLLDLGLRLGEASGAALAVPLLRAAAACHGGMATFAEAEVSEKKVSGET